jgi:hypothetical protein
VDVTVIKNVRDVSGLAVAATHDEALVTVSVSGDVGCPYDGCEVYGETYAVTFDAQGGASKLTQPPVSAVGVSPSSVAVPFVMNGALHLLTQGHGGAAPIAGPGQDPPDTIYVVRDGKILKRTIKWFSGYFAVASTNDGAIALGTGEEWGWYKTGTDDAPRSVRAFVVARDGGVTGEVVDKNSAPAHPSSVNDRPPEMMTPAIAADGDRAAYAYQRTKRLNGPKELVVGFVDAKTAKPMGAPVVVASGDIGRPAVLLEGDTLSVVWAARDGAKDPYALRRATLKSGETATSTPSRIATPTPTGLSPSLAKIGGTVALAWMDAADTSHGAVWAGIGATIDDAARAGEKRSGADVKNARDPRWGAAGDRAALSWTEHDGPRRVRLAWCAPPR